nr:ribonuclease H-like domain-containing protein [Tanacetum cinerariifolium]
LLWPSVIEEGVTRLKNYYELSAAEAIQADCDVKATNIILQSLPLEIYALAEAVNTACYVQNRVLVTKPHNKTPYELFHGRPPAISFLRPFGCSVTILNTIDHLGKFDGKANEGFFVGYSLNSKAFRVFNSRTRIMEDNLHVRFSENTPNPVGSGPNWLFDIDALTKTMNYQPVVAQSNNFSSTKACNDAGKEKEPDRDYILLPLWTANSPLSATSKSSEDNEFQPLNDGANRVDEYLSKENECNAQGEEDNTNSTNRLNTITLNINAASSSGVNVVGTNISIKLPPDLNMHSLEHISYLKTLVMMNMLLMQRLTFII